MSQRSGSRAAIVEVTQVKQKRLCEEKKQNKTELHCLLRRVWATDQLTHRRLPAVL